MLRDRPLRLVIAAGEAGAEAHVVDLAADGRPLARRDAFGAACLFEIPAPAGESHLLGCDGRGRLVVWSIPADGRPRLHSAKPFDGRLLHVLFTDPPIAVIYAAGRMSVARVVVAPDGPAVKPFAELGPAVDPWARLAGAGEHAVVFYGDRRAGSERPGVQARSLDDEGAGLPVDVPAAPVRLAVGRHLAGEPAPELLIAVDDAHTATLLAAVRGPPGPAGAGYRALYPLEAPGLRPSLAAFHPSGRLAAVAGGRGLPVAFWHITAADRTRRPQAERRPADDQADYLKGLVRKADCAALEFSADGRLLTGADSDGRIHVWQVQAQRR
jgi:hypothetical protein